MMWDSGAGMGWWMIFGSVWFIIFWAIIIWAIVKGASQEAQRDNQASPLDIARQRYARGEINRDEFEQIRKDLA